ncbi:hypothetical protein JX265_001282 [Neoarthrinium moseri]|uniref:S-adenosyl-L-methionine-dependent methyltransferase n=1 Tax=Neoarthrinium moseri TaxID=1658444 RepID=A0A9P9WXD7_9PEZI|nr:hypothetical protein JX265_001282 [Neoarthrinium moseri]
MSLQPVPAQHALRGISLLRGSRAYLNQLPAQHTGSRSVRRASSGIRRSAPPHRKTQAAKPLPFKPAPPKAASPPPPSSPATPGPESSNDNRSGTGTGTGSSGGEAPRKFSVAELVRTRWIALFGAGAMALCLGSFTASFVYLNLSPAPKYETGHEPTVPTGRPGIQSPLEFDLHLDKSEHRYGITKLRRQLGERATGHVLEVAVGTGRNLEFYDWAAVTAAHLSTGERNRGLLEKSGWGARRLEDVREMLSFTGLDISETMLDIGLRRVRQVVPHGVDQVPKKASFAQQAGQGGGHVSLLDGKLRIMQGDAQDGLPAGPGPAGRYDTVVQTFGLCSVRDPARLLANMARVVVPETGRILLLEHGRSWWELVNGLLDRSAQGHFDRFGCWWNRDIEDIVERAQAAVPGLEVVEIRRPGWSTLGTHLWIELRVREVGGQEPKEDGRKPAAEDGKGWASWLNLGSSALTPKPQGEAKK